MVLRGSYYSIRFGMRKPRGRRVLVAQLLLHQAQPQADQGHRSRQHRRALAVPLRLPYQPVQLPPQPGMQTLVPVHRPTPAGPVPGRRQPGLIHHIGVTTVRLRLRQPFVQPQKGGPPRSPSSKSPRRRPSDPSLTAVQSHASRRFSPCRAPTQLHISSKAVIRSAAWRPLSCRCQSSRVRAQQTFCQSGRTPSAGERPGCGPRPGCWLPRSTWRWPAL